MTVRRRMKITYMPWWRSKNWKIYHWQIFLQIKLSSEDLVFLISLSLSLYIYIYIYIYILRCWSRVFQTFLFKKISNISHHSLLVLMQPVWMTLNLFQEQSKWCCQYQGNTCRLLVAHGDHHWLTILQPIHCHSRRIDEETSSYVHQGKTSNFQ